MGWQFLGNYSVQSSCSNTVKPVLNGHLKIEETKLLKTDGSFMLLLSGRLRRVLLYTMPLLSILLMKGEF